MKIILFTFVTFAFAAHPECRWACDDPICSARCAPVCQPPACQVQCTAPHTCSVTRPSCSNRCNTTDQSESDSCPYCETICLPLACPGCDILCEAPICQWTCVKPDKCPKPRCELQCERPACEASSAAPGPQGRGLLLAAIIVLASLIL